MKWFNFEKGERCYLIEGKSIHKRIFSDFLVRETLQENVIMPCNECSRPCDHQGFGYKYGCSHPIIEYCVAPKLFFTDEYGDEHEFDVHNVFQHKNEAIKELRKNCESCLFFVERVPSQNEVLDAWEEMKNGMLFGIPAPVKVSPFFTDPNILPPKELGDEIESLKREMHIFEFRQERLKQQIEKVISEKGTENQIIRTIRG